MNCPNCKEASKKNGKDKTGEQKYKCSGCGSVFTTKPKLEGKRVPAAKIEMIINLLVEGNSVRSTERITGVHRDTILRLLETVGQRCIVIHETLVRNVKVDNIEADEIWGYVRMKQKTANSQGLGDDESIGSNYTYTAIEKHSKLILAWHLGRRNEENTYTFLSKLRKAVNQETQFQISTDAFNGYRDSIPAMLGDLAHFGQVRKFYGIPNPDEVRYSGSEVTHIIKKRIHGNPVKANISTSIVERNNFTMRMSMRRLTRLTNGFSKKIENLNYALALNFVYYNFCRIHRSLRCTPAMEAGLTNHIWELKDIIGIK